MGTTFLPEKFVRKFNKMTEFYVILARKISKIPEFFIILFRKINKIAEFYVIFARKMPEFYIKIARKIFFPIFFGRGARGGTCPHLPPVSYADDFPSERVDFESPGSSGCNCSMSTHRWNRLPSCPGRSAVCSTIPSHNTTRGPGEVVERWRKARLWLIGYQTNQLRFARDSRAKIIPSILAASLGEQTSVAVTVTSKCQSCRLLTCRRLPLIADHLRCFSRCRPACSIVFTPQKLPIGHNQVRK